MLSRAERAPVGKSRFSAPRCANAGLVAAAFGLGLSGPCFAAVTISSGATQNMNCSGGVCAPTAKKAVLNVGDLESMLASGNVAVTTTGSGVEANDIVLDAALAWSDASGLSLAAHASITTDQPLSVNGLAALSLTTNNGSSGGRLSFGPKGQVQFANLSSALAINGTAYTLVNSIASLGSAIATNPAGAYALAADYDASKDGVYRDSPIPTELTGTFEGLGNSISHFTLHFRSKRGEVGFFQMIGASGTVDDVRLRSERIVVKKFGEVFGLAATNEGAISGDEVQGSFVGTNCLFAGLVGENDGTISFSSADVTMSTVEGGGLVSGNRGVIMTSRAGGSISSSGEGPDTVGGLLVFNQGTVDQSYANVTVAVNSQTVVGGLVGDDEGLTTNSYATGSVTGGNAADVGGLDGWAVATVKTSYSTGAVSGGSSRFVGGFLGVDDSSGLTNSYWDTTTSGTDQGTGTGNVSGLTGLTTQQLQSGLPPGFDRKIWAENPKINGGLPYLIANPPP